MNYKEQFDFWLNDDYFDEGTKQELLAIRNDEKEIEDRFYRELEFGTGGLRGVIGAGTNRMNVYTVRKASQGLANYIIKNNACDKGVAIAYDSRRFSPEFADEAALCLAANGIKAYVFDALRPTPMLSFALRQLGCTAGIVVTASHNPPEYNGYKVYWEDGAQVTPPHDNNIIGEVNAITDYHTVKTMDKQEAINKGLYNVIGKELDDKANFCGGCGNVINNGNNNYQTSVNNMTGREKIFVQVLQSEPIDKFFSDVPDASLKVALPEFSDDLLIDLELNSKTKAGLYSLDPSVTVSKVFDLSENGRNSAADIAKELKVEADHNRSHFAAALFYCIYIFSRSLGNIPAFPFKNCFFIFTGYVNCVKEMYIILFPCIK